jgi:formylglycine-generating enzyme required for sulfatase activity
VNTDPEVVNNNLYYVIDLSGGTSAASYPITTLSAPPGGVWSDEYKTTKLVLRRIEAGSFRMKGSYDVTLTQPFYIGVFEVTQKQYELVTGNNPSYYKGDTRPVEYVSWNTIRGNSDSYNWPNVKTVDPNSFVGLLRLKTGLPFDLPTEAQWEYACRAGTTSSYNNGGNTEADLKTLGRYSGNQNDGRGGYSQHTKVGSYAPNAWGLYDMHGNVNEWCLDWYGSLSNGTDSLGPVSGSDRVLRGRSWLNYASYCSSSIRGSYYPSFNDIFNGFRLACSVGL